MPAINPDPHRFGYEFLPDKCVTAMFAQITLATAALDRLREIGFNDSKLQVFAGNKGADQLDVDGEKM